MLRERRGERPAGSMRKEGLMQMQTNVMKAAPGANEKRECNNDEARRDE